jgi:RNA recognition motif-containing protein
MLERNSHRSRGFGFVWFPDETSREAAIDKHNKTEISGRNISVTRPFLNPKQPLVLLPTRFEEDKL